MPARLYLPFSWKISNMRPSASFTTSAYSVNSIVKLTTHLHLITVCSHSRLLLQACLTWAIKSGMPLQQSVRLVNVVCSQFTLQCQLSIPRRQLPQDKCMIAVHDTVQVFGNGCDHFRQFDPQFRQTALDTPNYNTQLQQRQKTRVTPKQTLNCPV